MLNSTGLRLSEAISLNWTDIDISRKTILVRNTKGNRTEEIPLIDDAIEVFDEFPKNGERIFNYKGRASLNSLRKELSKYGYSFHDFRRTFGTRWAKKL